MPERVSAQLRNLTLKSALVALFSPGPRAPISGHVKEMLLGAINQQR